MDVGDRLIGIGLTHLIESLSRPPGLDSFRAIFDADVSKVALRAFEVARKEPGPDGIEFSFAPLSPSEYSETLEAVSEGAVRIPAESIPLGTIILSFVDSEPTYTLRAIERSSRENWARATKGQRHWNVGIGDDADFWSATFPSDDIGILPHLPRSAAVGTIRFGLSLLPSSETRLDFERVPWPELSGRTTAHHFCLVGSAAGTNGFATPFPIGLRTEIVCKPVGGG
jgi:hypothetical protein